MVLFGTLSLTPRKGKELNQQKVYSKYTRQSEIVSGSIGYGDRSHGINQYVNSKKYQRYGMINCNIKYRNVTYNYMCIVLKLKSCVLSCFLTHFTYVWISACMFSTIRITRKEYSWTNTYNLKLCKYMELDVCIYIYITRTSIEHHDIRPNGL